MSDIIQRDILEPQYISPLAAQFPGLKAFPAPLADLGVFRIKVQFPDIPSIDHQDIYYYSASSPNHPEGQTEWTPNELTFEELGIWAARCAQLSGMAADAVMDSVSVKTTFKESLAELASFSAPSVPP